MNKEIPEGATHVSKVSGWFYRLDEENKTVTWMNSGQWRPSGNTFTQIRESSDFEPVNTPSLPHSFEPMDEPKQVGGDHYTKMAIQPVEYILANDLGFLEGNVIKYVSRHGNKGGVEDLKKARHYLDILIERGGK